MTTIRPALLHAAMRFPAPTVLRRWFAAAVLACIALAAHAQPHDYRVDVTGAGELSRLLEDNLDIARHAGDRDMTPDEWRRLFAAAPTQIRALLATEGYFMPELRPALREDNGATVAGFDVRPGVATLVERVDIRFTGALAELPAQAERIATLRAAWSLAPGMRFRQGDWDAAKAALVKPLLEHDFPAARISHSEAAIDSQGQRAALTLEVDSGPAYSFGALQVQGLQRYPAELVEGLNPIRPGEPYAQERLTELQARLQDSGYFLTVFATIDVETGPPQGIPVRVDMVENPRRRLSTGIGFSTDAGARLQLKWLDRRFYDRNWLFDSELRVDRQSRLAAGSLHFPVRDNGWRPTLGARFERSDITNEIDDKLRIDARLAGPLQLDEQVAGISWLTERQKIPGADPNNRQALVATFSHTRRRVDNLVSPTSGYVAAVDLAAGPRGLFNQANIARAYGRLTWLMPLGTRWQALARAQAGQVFGAGRELVPGDLLFRAGGDQSVRGYAYNSLGVKENGAVTGGRVMAVATAELVYAVTPTIGAAVFHDAGNAADRWQGFHAEQASGIGARWRTPIGAINLDVAWARATHKPRLHFSVGYGF